MESRNAELAINGGPKAFTEMTGKPRPKIGVEEFMAVAERFGFKPEALGRIRAAISDEDFLGTGPNLARYVCAFPAPPKGELFEQFACARFGVPHAFSVSSGTAALHAAFVAAGVGPGTEVIVPALGFAATAMAVVLAGGVPVFCDVDTSLQIDPDKIAALIAPRTVAIAPTHHSGNVSDMERVMDVARGHDLKVIEDCAQAPGARYRGRYVGAIGDLGCFSISAYKIIGGGEGGLVLTHDPRLFDRVRQLAESGGLWRPDRFAPPRYEGELFSGTNYRMSELEAAIDVVQLGRLDEICDRYRRVSRRIRRQLRRFREITPQKINDADGYIGFVLRFFPRDAELSARLCAALTAEGVAAGTRGINHAPDWHMYRDMFPVVLKTGHTLGASAFEDPRYLARGGKAEYRPGACPVAEDLFAREVALSLDQWYSDEDCDNIAQGINKVLGAYCTEDADAPAWG